LTRSTGLSDALFIRLLVDYLLRADAMLYNFIAIVYKISTFPKEYDDFPGKRMHK